LRTAHLQHIFHWLFVSVLCINLLIRIVKCSPIILGPKGSQCKLKES
jgi:hypothetical protein